MSANHHDPNTSKNPAACQSLPQKGWSRLYAATRCGLLGICGISDPTTAAAASINSRTIAVRIERSVRQTSATDLRRDQGAEATGPDIAVPMLPAAVRRQ